MSGLPDTSHFIIVTSRAFIPVGLVASNSALWAEINDIWSAVTGSHSDGRASPKSRTIVAAKNFGGYWLRNCCDI